MFNAVTLIRLSGSQSQLGAHATDDEREATRLRAEAARTRARIDPRQLDIVSTASREARGLVDRRSFKWVTLLSQFEVALPPEVRLKAVQPQLDDGRFTVAVIVQARRVEDLSGFIEALEATGAFHAVQPKQQTRSESGLLEAVIEGAYTEPPPSQGEAR
jgi:hypothetical protein